MARKDQIRLRRATPNDLELLQYWDTKQHVIDCDPDGDWNWEEELKKTPIWRSQYMAELEGRPIGFIQIIDPKEEESHYWGSIEKNLRAIDIWIGEESDLNKGYGTQMMQLAIEKCFEHPDVHKILIDPLLTNVKAHRFYERIGFQFVEERTFEGVKCKVYEYIRNNNEDA
ncbi:MAG: GNAT family N-acetyltransferase [Saprospiraceae bacterium]|nr:GNAT family N-acetyltransferase [Saprospiraceae bacterium]